MQILVLIVTVGASSQIGEILTFTIFVTFLTVLTFFSITCPDRTAGPIVTLYGSNDVYMYTQGGTFWVRIIDVAIWVNMISKPLKVSVNRQFQAKTPKYNNRNISETISPINTEFEDRAETNVQLHFVGGLTLPKLNPIWLPAAISKMDMTS